MFGFKSSNGVCSRDIDGTVWCMEQIAGTPNLVGIGTSQGSICIYNMSKLEEIYSV